MPGAREFRLGTFPSCHLPVPVTDGSVREKVNKIAGRLWTRSNKVESARNIRDGAIHGVRGATPTSVDEGVTYP